MTGPGLYILSFLPFLTCFLLLCPGETMPFLVFPNPSQKEEALLIVGPVIRNLDHCDRRDSLVFPKPNFPFISNVTPNYTCTLLDISHWVKPQQPGFPVSCFVISHHNSQCNELYLFTRINSSREVKTQLHNTWEQACWPQKIPPDDPWFDLNWFGLLL